MFNFLSTSKIPDLRKAGNLLIIEAACFVTLAFALSQLGVPSGQDAAFLGALLFNLLPAYFLAKAAHSQGKSTVFYGLLSLIPAGAIASYFWLRNNELFSS